MMSKNRKNKSNKSKNNNKIRRRIIINIKWFQNKKMRNSNKNQNKIQIIKTITKHIKITIKTKAVLIKINK